MRISRVIWNEEAIEHIARHGITPEEAEEVCFSGPLIVRGRGPRKLRIYAVLGQSARGRHLLVVLRCLGQGRGRVITAREMNQAERRRYQGSRR